MSLNPLRNLPSVHELLESPRLKALMDRISHNSIVATGRAVLNEVHRELQTAAADRSLPSVSDLAERIARKVTERPAAPLRNVINATGMILHPELGRPPVAEEAIAEMESILANYSASDSWYGQSPEMAESAEAESLLQALSGAEAALVVNNNAAGVFLALAAVAQGREVLVSRGQLINAGGDCPMSELIASSGAVLREVGATNKTTVDDYAAALGERTAALLVIELNASSSAAASSPSLAELIELARRAKLPLLYNLGLGSLVDLRPFGLGGEVNAVESVKAGADAIFLSGDKLLGGPACGIVLGRHALVEQMQHHPIMRTLRAGRAVRAGLAATLRLYVDAERARFRIPVLALSGTSPDNLRNRAERLAPQIAALAGIESAEATADVAQWCEGVKRPLPTWCIAVRPATRTAEELAMVLRSGSPAVVGKLCEGRVVLDLRTVFPRQDGQIVEAFEGVERGDAEVRS